MAQYKVPQDVEADDKLIGPFSFRQFVYLLIGGGLIALAVGLFQIFPVLAIIPVPFILFFGALALPIKKDQPMETYLAAIVSYYIKPRTRLWTPGQRNSSIQITVPKKVEESRTRNITGEEATHRLSFLADIVDTEGYAIKGIQAGKMREDLAVEAAQATDMFETQHFTNLAETIVRDENQRHAEVIREMQDAINENEQIDTASAKIVRNSEREQPEASAVTTLADRVVKAPTPAIQKKDILDSNAVVRPEVASEPVENSERATQKTPKKAKTEAVKPSIIELANNADFSVATIAKEANRINRKEEGEVFISLH